MDYFSFVNICIILYFQNNYIEYSLKKVSCYKKKEILTFPNCFPTIS